LSFEEDSTDDGQLGNLEWQSKGVTGTTKFAVDSNIQLRIIKVDGQDCLDDPDGPPETGSDG
jgi:hypothetical protein